MDDQTDQIIGAALEVHKELGCGFLEPVYQEALELEVGDRGIPFCPQAAMPTVRKETETKNLRNLCNLRIFPNSLFDRNHEAGRSGLERVGIKGCELIDLPGPAGFRTHVFQR